MVFGNNAYINEGNTNQNYNIDILEYDYDKDSGFTMEEIECFIIADDIKKKVESHYQVFDKDELILRDIKYSDFAILIDRSSTFDLFKKIFEYKQIPLNILKEEKMNNDKDVYVLNNLLKFIIKIANHEYDTTFKYLFSLYKDGADSLQNLCCLYKNKQLLYKDRETSFYDYFKNKYNITPSKPVIFIMDNEIENKNKPIRKFLNGTNNSEFQEQLKQNFYIPLKNSPNMYLLTFPTVNNMKECEIEDLHTQETLNTIINNKHFNKNGGEQYYGKDKFANFVYNNYHIINMDNFKSILDKINDIITEFHNT